RQQAFREQATHLAQPGSFSPSKQDSHPFRVRELIHWPCRSFLCLEWLKNLRMRQTFAARAADQKARRPTLFLRPPWAHFQRLPRVSMKAAEFGRTTGETRRAAPSMRTGGYRHSRSSRPIDKSSSIDEASAHTKLTAGQAIASRPQLGGDFRWRQLPAATVRRGQSQGDRSRDHCG